MARIPEEHPLFQDAYSQEEWHGEMRNSGRELTRCIVVAHDWTSWILVLQAHSLFCEHCFVSNPLAVKSVFPQILNINSLDRILEHKILKGNIVLLQGHGRTIEAISLQWWPQGRFLMCVDKPLQAGHGFQHDKLNHLDCGGVTDQQWNVYTKGGNWKASREQAHPRRHLNHLIDCTQPVKNFDEAPPRAYGGRSRPGRGTVVGRGLHRG